MPGDDITAKDGLNAATGVTKMAAGQLPTLSEAKSTAKVALKGIKVQLACCGSIFFLAIFVGLFVMSLLNPASGKETPKTPTPTPGVANPTTKAQWLVIYKNAGSVMKIEWEFLASITKQETGMGHNFGNCSYFAPAPSSGHVLTSGNGLRSAADKTAFQNIMEKLNMPLNTPVSCNPVGSNGGAIGYTQFMPREWKAGATALQSLLGHYANPWNATDATIMAGRLLKAKVDIGQSATMPVDEALYRKAASRYYGDGNPNGAYANNVYRNYLIFKRDQHL